MATYRHQVVLHTGDNVPKNFITNSWYTTADTLFDMGEQLDALITFYKNCQPIFSTYLAQNGHQVKSYNIADPEPRVPVEERTWNFVSSFSQPPLPAEVAVCLSFQALPVSGVNQARRRGRVYLGPLNQASVDTGGRPSATRRTLIGTEAAGLKDAIEAVGTGSNWVVYSQVGNSVSIVDNGWIDDDFDTQRRRQSAVTTRTVFS